MYLLAGFKDALEYSSLAKHLSSIQSSCNLQIKQINYIYSIDKSIILTFVIDRFYVPIQIIN